MWDAHYRYEDMNEAQQIGVDAHARVFVTETDGQLKIYSTRTGKLIHELPGTHTYPKRATVQVKLSPDGRHVAVSHQDGSLRVWTLPAELSPR